jgi:hypothetical protein
MNVLVVVGSEDRIFRPSEIQKTLDTHNLDKVSLVIVPGVEHSPLISRNGEKLWSVAVE